MNICSDRTPLQPAQLTPMLQVTTQSALRLRSAIDPSCLHDRVVCVLGVSAERRTPTPNPPSPSRQMAALV
jgi:hypothetical protein